MSVGPAALGNVLVQRLDAVLGTTMSRLRQSGFRRAPGCGQPARQPGETGQADGSPRDPRQGVQTGGARGERAAIVDAKTAAALAWPRAAWSPATTPPLPRPPRWAAARAILSLLAQYPDAAPPVQGRAPLWTPMHRPAASPYGGQPAAGQPAPGGQPRRHANTPAGQPQAAAANSAANVATVLNAIAGDPATAAGKTPGRPAPPRGAPPRRPPPRRGGRAGSGRPRAGPGPARPCRPAACSTNHTWPIWPSAAATHPSCAKNRRPTSSRPTPSKQQRGRRARGRPPAVARRRGRANGSNAPRPARRSTASTRT